jgi:hypothetical protein
MAEKIEKRNERRYDCNADFEWAYFNTENRSDCRMLNCSRSGGYFESSLETHPGATIIMRLKRRSAVNKEAGSRETPRTTTLATVEWCRKLPGRAGGQFGVGVKYFVYF